MKLSLEDLRQYCRTCLVQLDVALDNGSTKAVATKKHPEVYQLLRVCLARKGTAEDDRLCLYAPFLCRSCFDKWLDFLKFQQLAAKTDERIREILNKEVFKDGFTNNDNKNLNEHYIDTDTLGDLQEVEKYETYSPFFINGHLSDTDEKESANDDPTQQNMPLESREIDTFKCHDYYNEFANSCSDVENGNDLENKIKSNSKAIKPRKNKKTRKSLYSVKKSCKARKLLKKYDENHTLPQEEENEYNTHQDDNNTKKVQYQCELCDKYFWEKNKYDGHMKQVHEGIRRAFLCDLCNKAYSLYKTLLQHKRECHSEKAQKTYKCDDCDKIFKTAVILKQHITNKHSKQKEAKRSICDQCGFIAAHQYSLSRHIINKHTETDQIKCEHCPKVFKTQYSLKYHVMGNHNPSNLKPFKCSECEMGFTRKTLLNQHKRTHLKYTERIKCDFEGCEVRFVKQGDKAHHMRLVHLKVKQHICDFCGEAFGAMQTLRHHRFIHTGEKPYKCNVCGQGFRQRTAMKTHRKTHSGKEAESQEIIHNLPELNLSLVNT